jgi:hypothetical protein
VRTADTILSMGAKTIRIALIIDSELPPHAGTCALCRIQVPLDELVVPEMMDRLTWLCGLDCYASWRADAAGTYPMLRHRSH